MNTLTLTLIAAAAAIGLAGCTGSQSSSPPILDSGITSSNGGGQRELGNLPNVTIGPNGARVTQQPRDPRVPTY